MTKDSTRRCLSAGAGAGAGAKLCGRANGVATENCAKGRRKGLQNRSDTVFFRNAEISI